MKNKEKEIVSGNIVKVKYSFDRISQREGTAIMIALAGVAMLLIFTISAVVNPSTVSSLGTGLLYAGFLFFISIPQLLSERSKRMSQKREHEEAVKNGTKVIGTIVNLGYTDLGGKGTNDRNFGYTIEYEDPDHGEQASMFTPSAISENMCITDKDLPLKAIVYLHEGKGYIDAVVDPPLVQMGARKVIKKSPVIAIIICIILCVVLYSIGQVIASGIAFIIGAAILIIYIHYQQTHR